MADRQAGSRELYGLPLERFTEERNALAKQLRKEGRREEAAEVAKLRKPSVAAWAVNQLVRTQARDAKALFDAGEVLQKAQADLLAGRAEAGALRSAVEAERDAVDRLTEKARGLLHSSGQELGAARLEQVAETLHAAALDDAARAQVRDGCLQRELRHVGLGAVGPSPTSAGRPAKAHARDEGAAPRRAREERAEQLRSARKREAEARRQMERATRDAGAAQQRRDRAAVALREADEALAKARGIAEEREAEHRRAQAALDDL